MTTEMLEIEIGQLQELPESEAFAVDELGGAELMRCSSTCWFSCLYTCERTE